MFVKHILRSVLSEIPGNPDIVDEIRNDRSLVYLFSEVYRLLHPEDQQLMVTDFRRSIAVPTRKLNREELFLFYKSWGLRESQCTAISIIDVQPADLLEMPPEKLDRFGSTPSTQREIRRAVEMLKVILGIKRWNGPYIPSADYTSSEGLRVTYMQRDVTDRTFQYLEKIGFPWLKSLNVVSIALNREFTVEYLMNMEFSEIESRKTWRNIAPKVRLLKLYLEAIKKAES